jgi:hypothetical protein
MSAYHPTWQENLAIILFTIGLLMTVSGCVLAMLYAGKGTIS